MPDFAQSARSAAPASLPAALSARSIKITVVLDPVAVLAAITHLQKIDARIPFTVDVDGRKLTCDFAPKAVRRCFVMIKEHGAEGVAVLIQGKLGKGDVVLEAGLTAQPKREARKEAA
jgi:hypothetical protein